MLSQPFPFVSMTFLETNKFNKFFIVSSLLRPKTKSHLTSYNNPALLFSNLYQIPSQPINIKFRSLPLI